MTSNLCDTSPLASCIKKDDIDQDHVHNLELPMLCSSDLDVMAYLSKNSLVKNKQETSEKNVRTTFCVQTVGQMQNFSWF